MARARRRAASSVSMRGIGNSSEIRRYRPLFRAVNHASQALACAETKPRRARRAPASKPARSGRLRKRRRASRPWSRSARPRAAWAADARARGRRAPLQLAQEIRKLLGVVVLPDRELIPRESNPRHDEPDPAKE